MKIPFKALSIPFALGAAKAHSNTGHEVDSNGQAFTKKQTPLKIFHQWLSPLTAAPSRQSKFDHINELDQSDSGFCRTESKRAKPVCEDEQILATVKIAYDKLISNPEDARALVYSALPGASEACVSLIGEHLKIFNDRCESDRKTPPNDNRWNDSLIIAGTVMTCALVALSISQRGRQAIHHQVANIITTNVALWPKLLSEKTITQENVHAMVAQLAGLPLAINHQIRYCEDQISVLEQVYADLPDQPEEQISRDVTQGIEHLLHCIVLLEDLSKSLDLVHEAIQSEDIKRLTNELLHLGQALEAVRNSLNQLVRGLGRMPVVSGFFAGQEDT